MPIEVNNELLKLMKLFDFKLIECSFKGEVTRSMFKVVSKISQKDVQKLFLKLGFNDVHEDIVNICSNLSLLAIGTDKCGDNKALKLYFKNIQERFINIAGDKSLLLFEIAKQNKLEVMCALNLYKDKQSGLTKKIYLDIPEQECNLQIIELKDLNKKLLNALPDLMNQLNFNLEKVNKINNTIAVMHENDVPLTCIGVDIDSSEIKLYFDHGQ